jgi:hypothetical protein
VGDGENKQPCIETLHHQYEQVCTSYHAIDDFRAKLLALWPILGGAAGGVALLAPDNTNERYLGAIAVFGAFASVGLGVYEWNQSLRCDRLKQVARELEEKMHLQVGTGQFLSIPDGFTPRFSAPSLRACETTEPSGGNPKWARFIRVRVASVIVYVSVILGWIGLALWGLL